MFKVPEDDRRTTHGGYELIPTINHWIGQDDAIRRFKVALEASWHTGEKLPHMLLLILYLTPARKFGIC